MTIALGLAIVAIGSILKSTSGDGIRYVVLFALGFAIGLVLYHSRFGFAGAWRQFITVGDGRGLRSQMVMLAIAICLFFPALAKGHLFGRPVTGFIMPAGMNIVIGSFIFGIGMQLSGACSSGTLRIAGGGNVKMLITLFFFILGSAIGTYLKPDWWISLPSLGVYSFIEQWGLGPALVINLSLCAAIILGTLALEERRGTVHDDTIIVNWYSGPWPLLVGAIGLALLNYATLATAGHPWGITSGFILWGTKWLSAFGVDMSQSLYWQHQMGRISGSVWGDTASVMNFGILTGAMLAAGLAGRFKPVLSFSGGEIVTLVVGGLLLGYGARMAFGCNIGALFSGIASGSLHGWLWLIFGFLGNLVGTRLHLFVAGQRA